MPAKAKTPKADKQKEAESASEYRRDFGKEPLTAAEEAEIARALKEVLDDPRPLISVESSFDVRVEPIAGTLDGGDVVFAVRVTGVVTRPGLKATCKGHVIHLRVPAKIETEGE